MDPTRPTATLIVLALATLLSGCLGANVTLDADDPMRDGTPRREVLYNHSWVGTNRGEDTFQIRESYDYLVNEWTHTGQTLGAPVYTAPGGQAMDEAPASGSNGPSVVSRVLPPTVGTATVTLPALAQGTGTYTVLGVANVPPGVLLQATWTERGDGYGPLETKMHFYVPPGYHHLDVAMVAAGGGWNPGIRISDPSGETRAEMSTTNTGATGSSSDATPGLWTLHLNGMYSGTFSVTVFPR